MQVRKFTANNMREALAAVKDALGPDAIIVATRPVPPEHMFGKPRLEVTAALEAPSATPAPAAVTTAARRARVTADEALEASALDPLRRELRAIRSELRQYEREPTELRQELREVRELMDGLSRGRDGSPPPEIWAARVLHAADVNPRLTRILSREVARRLRADDLHTNSETAQSEQARILKEVVRGILRCDQTFVQSGRQPRVALVGPTGVGKTTTIAKLAANAAMRDKRSVVLISLDSYRVGAFEQLQQYARLMKVPAFPARDRKEFAALLHRNDGADIIFIDTAGRGPSDGGAYMEDLAQHFAGNDVSPLMTISAATRSNELGALLDVYRAVEPVGTLFTKLDEAMVLGAVLNAQQAYKVPATYLTMGQRVPEDIAPAHAQVLADRFVDSASAALDAQTATSPTFQDTRHAHT